MPIRPLPALVALALAAPLGAQPVFQPPPSAKGDVLVSVNGGLGPPGAGARYWIDDHVSVGLTWDRTGLDDPDPSGDAFPGAALDSRTNTITASVESDAALTGGWLRFGLGASAFAQRQTDDVARPDAVVVEDGRRVDRVGVAGTARFEARVAGPLRVGVSGGLLGLSLQRQTGGSVEDDGAVTALGDDETRTTVDFDGGSVRIYAGLRF